VSQLPGRSVAVEVGFVGVDPKDDFDMVRMRNIPALSKIDIGHPSHRKLINK
jgi:hypothetical protein